MKSSFVLPVLGQRLETELIPQLIGGWRKWLDTETRSLVDVLTIYVAFGCPDWGTQGGKRRKKNCIFCSLPDAAKRIEDEFFDGKAIPPAMLVSLFNACLDRALEGHSVPHTVFIFNAGSYLAMHRDAQIPMLEKLKAMGVKRVVLESRASHITRFKVSRLMDILAPAGIACTIRIGLETQDDALRGQLGKGNPRQEVEKAMGVMREHDVTSGAYVLLNPYPELDPAWARKEAEETIDWVLGETEGQLGMDEAYFRPTCVAGGESEIPLIEAWQKERFQPASLWETLSVLCYGASRYPGRVHMLPLRDEPPFVAVPSNHVPKGLPQSLEGAEGCDRKFHALLERYRLSMDANVLISPSCACRPDWFQASVE